MSRQIIIDIMTFEEAAEVLNMEPETVKKAVEDGIIKAGSIYDIPGHLLSSWWLSIGGKKGMFLDDYLEDVPWLPAIFAKAVETFGNRAKARVWLLNEIHTLGYRSPIDFARENALEVLHLLGRIEHGVLS